MNESSIFNPTNETTHILSYYLENPWTPQGMDVLPVIRAGKEEAIPALIEYLNFCKTSASSQEEAPALFASDAIQPMAEMASIVLLGEFGRSDQYDLMWDVLLKDDNAEDINPIPVLFMAALLDAMSEAYPGNAARAKAVLLDPDVSGPMRALGAELYAYGVRNDMADRQEALDIFRDLMDDTDGMHASLAAALCGAAIYAGLDELNPMIEQIIPLLPEDTITLEELRTNPIPSPKFSDNLPVLSENYQELADVAYQLINEAVSTMEPQEEAEELPDWYDSELEAIMENLDGMNQHEIAVYMQQHPDVALRLQKYIRRAVPVKDMLANKKSSAPTQSLDAFKSKKKKKGGKKPAKKAGKSAKGKKK